MDSQLVEKYKQLETAVSENERRLSELKGRLSSEEEAKKGILAKLKKEYKISSEDQLIKTINQLEAALVGKMQEIETALEG